MLIIDDCSYCPFAEGAVYGDLCRTSLMDPEGVCCTVDSNESIYSVYNSIVNSIREQEAYYDRLEEKRLKEKEKRGKTGTSSQRRKI